MNQSDLVAKCAERAEISKAKMKEILDIVGQVILEGVKQNEVVTFPVIGRFSKKVAKERSCKNPRTGEKMIVPAKAKLAYSASLHAKQELQSK
jgi:DNA-binding protein HU-beta